jgi:hypothetical protein
VAKKSFDKKRVCHVVANFSENLAPWFSVSSYARDVKAEEHNILISLRKSFSLHSGSEPFAALTNVTITSGGEHDDR